MGNKNFDWADWERWEAEAANSTQAAAPTVINNYFFVDNSINIQSIISDGQTSARIVDARSRLADDIRRYLPPNYQSGNMDETEKRIAANPNYAYLPLTKEELAGKADRGW